MDKIRQFGYQMDSRMAQFMYGRNGFDNLAKICNGIAILLLVINIFAQSRVVYLLWLAFYAYSCFRVYSRNIPKRYAENQKFMSMTEIPRKRAKLLKLQWRDRSVSSIIVRGHDDRTNVALRCYSGHVQGHLHALGTIVHGR